MTTVEWGELREPLTSYDLVALWAIYDTTRVVKVARVMPDGNIVYGTARSLGDQNGNSMHDADVRDKYLRVTLKEGLEAFWPVRELMPQVQAGEFAAYDW